MPDNPNSQQRTAPPAAAAPGPPPPEKPALVIEQPPEWAPKRPLKIDTSGSKSRELVKVKLEGNARVLAPDPERKDAEGKPFYTWQTAPAEVWIPFDSYKLNPSMGPYLDPRTGDWVTLKSGPNDPWKLTDTEKGKLIGAQASVLATAARPPGSILTDPKDAVAEVNGSPL